MKYTLLTILTVCIFAFSCKKEETEHHLVRYEIEANALGVQVTYENEFESYIVEEIEGTYWDYQFTSESGDYTYLSCSQGYNYTRITMSIYVDEKLVKSETKEGHDVHFEINYIIP